MKVEYLVGEMDTLMADHWVGSKVENLADKMVLMTGAWLVGWTVGCWGARFDNYWVELKAVLRVENLVG